MKGIDRPEIPSAYEFLYDPMRYKVVYGGRGKAASWSFAQVLVYKSVIKKERILCTREVQNSIAESVHHLIKERIHALGFGDLFHITQNSIVCKLTGSQFIFRGFNDLTADAIKSMEGITKVWCAEAHAMGARSWRILAPTIRTGGSEIWVDFNPEEEDGVTYVKFTKNAPRRAVVKHINFDQNPYFPPELEEERQEALALIANARDDEERLEAQLEYDNVWLGAPRKMGRASIFGSRCYFEDFDTPEGVTFFHGLDFGYANDPNALIRCFESDDRTILYIDMEAFGYGVELDDLPALLDKIPTSRRWKIVADCSRPETISHIARRGFNVVGSEKWQGSVEDGITFIKSYKKVIIHSRCPHMRREAKKYSWKIDKVSKEILPVPLDEENHGWDAVRYGLDKRIRRRDSFFLN